MSVWGVQLYGGTSVSLRADTAQHGYFSFDDDNILTYILKGPERTTPVSTFRCRYLNCIAPTRPPTTIPPPTVSGTGPSPPTRATLHHHMVSSSDNHRGSDCPVDNIVRDFKTICSIESNGSVVSIVKAALAHVRPSLLSGQPTGICGADTNDPQNSD